MFKAAVYYKIVIRPVLMYGSENWELRKPEQNLLDRTQMRMLRIMMGIERKEQIRNEEIRARAGVANILCEKIGEARPRWLGHVERNIEEVVVMRTGKMEVGGHQKTGRPTL